MLRNFLYILSYVLIAAVSGCSLFQVPSSPEPLPGLTVENRSSEIAVAVVVQRTNGSAVQELNVTVSNGTAEASGSTGPAGRTYLELEHLSGAALTFDFNSDSLRWTERVSILPPGTNDVTVYFKVDQAGRVLLHRLEY